MGDAMVAAEVRPELKECPHCGAAAAYIESGPRVFVRCTGDGCFAETSSLCDGLRRVEPFGSHANLVASAWNRRRWSTPADVTRMLVDLDTAEAMVARLSDGLMKLRADIAEVRAQHAVTLLSRAARIKEGIATPATRECDEQA